MSLNSERFPLTSGLRNKHSENDGFKVIFISFVVFSIAITVALIVQIYYGEPEVVPHAAVSCDHQTCAGMGSALLRRGGSAVDAAVAAALCLAVVHPHASGLGGGGFLLLHDHAHNSSWAVDFRETAPAAAGGSNLTRLGGGAAAVPGLLRGLQLAHRRHGRLPWSELVRPAAQLARQGVVVSAPLAAAIDSHLSLAEVRSSAGLAVFLSGADRLARLGDTLNMTDLAVTLDSVERHGADAFYAGELTVDTVRELTSVGGLMTSQDLADYEPLQYQGLRRDYGNFSVLTTAAPSGGPALLTALAVAAAARLPAAPDHLRLHQLTEALRLTMAHFALLGDPGSSDAATAATAALLAPANISELAANVSGAAAAATTGPLPAPHTPAATHVSVIDDNEVYVSLVSGLGSYFGCKVRTSGGILFNNAMTAFYDAGAAAAAGSLNTPVAGRRPLSTAAPAVVMTSKVCGTRLVTGGSDVTLLAQALLPLLAVPAARANLSASLEAPRLHTAPETPQVGLEADRVPRLDSQTVEALRRLGHPSVEEPLPYPSCNGVTKYYDQLSSHADSRGGGTAVRF